MSMRVQVKVPYRLFSVQGHKQVMNAIHREGMYRVQAFYMPVKFSNDLFRRYPQARRRTTKYQIWKGKLVHRGLIETTRPNVFSGELRAATLAGARITATATKASMYISTGVGRFVTGARAGQSYSRALKDWQRQELEFFSEQDQQELADWAGDAYVDAADSPLNAGIVLKRPKPNFPPIPPSV